MERKEKKMKGLILKDLFVLRGYVKQFGLIFLFLLVWSVVVKSASFMTIYVVIIGSSLVMSTMSMDEAVSFNRFALAAPIDMRTIVKSKYLLLLVLVGGGAVISGFLNILLYILPVGMEAPFDFSGFTAVIMLFLIANGVVLPAMFRFGVEKARYINYVAMILVAALIGGGFFLLDEIGISGEKLERAFNSWLGIGSVLLGAGALLISYFVSVGIVKKKGL